LQTNFNVYQETLNTCAVFCCVRRIRLQLRDGEAKWKLFYA